jgi:hypothetical protein
LERRGCLAKTGEQRRGPYDHLENCWQMTVEVAV